jgi:hypothetical protein
VQRNARRRLVEILDGVEVAIDKGLVDEGPQVPSWLQLGAVGRLEYELEAVGHPQVLRAMPAALSNEVGQHKLEVGLGYVVGDVRHRGAHRRLDEARTYSPSKQ